MAKASARTQGESAEQGDVLVTSPRQREVYVSLRDAILGHSLSSGTKLPEDELSEIYSVSRTIVRAVLQGLARDRLVTLRPHRGASVATPSPREAREVFEARALVEPRAAALAAERATADDIARLRAHIAEEHELMHSGDDGEAVMQSARFHVEIATMADQTILLEFVRDLCSRSSLIISIYRRRRSAICDVNMHEELIEAIGNGNAAQASERMQAHLQQLTSSLDFDRGRIGRNTLAETLRP